MFMLTLKTIRAEDCEETALQIYLKKIRKNVNAAVEIPHRKR